MSFAQLRELGFARHAVAHRREQGRLHRVHRGVYAVGHARLTPRARLWAAVLTEVGALSHRSAAELWDLLPAPGVVVDVVTGGESRSTAALRVHRSATLRPCDVVVLEGLPVTTVARTLVDLAGILAPHRLRRIVHRAETLRVLDVARVDELLARGRPKGTKALRAALASLAAAEPDVTRSELEERFLALVAAAGLPAPRTNTLVHGHEVDFLWRQVVETPDVVARRLRALLRARAYASPASTSTA